MESGETANKEKIPELGQSQPHDQAELENEVKRKPVCNGKRRFKNIEKGKNNPVTGIISQVQGTTDDLGVDLREPLGIVNFGCSKEGVK